MDREDFKQRSDQLTDLDKSRLICGVLFSVAAFCMRTGVAIGSYTLTFGIILESWFLSAVYGAIFWLLLSGGLFDRGFIRRFGRLTPLVPFLTIFTIIVVVFSFFFFTSDSKERAIESAVEQAYEDAYQEHYKVIFNEGYEKGFDEGQADGYDVGHYEGHSEGYNEGYDHGYTKCEEDRLWYEYTQDDLDRLYRIGYEDACEDFGKESPFAD